MSIFDVLTLVGGLSLFLFGMNVMGQALERRAGDKFRTVLGKFTTGRVRGILTGLGVTAVIQSSSAVTVMVVGFVNSGLMNLRQAINVIMGANVGTTATAWLLSLAGIDGGSLFISLLKPSSFTPVLAFIGIILYMFCKNAKKKDSGLILLGFATLMFGMDTMTGAVSALGELPEFQQLFILFKNPILGVMAGAVLTAVIQSSSASVGILQALASTGQVSYNAALPIIMGQNIGTCITALISSAGTNKNAKRAAAVHLLFNIIGTAFCLSLYMILSSLFPLSILNSPASLFGIALCHSVFNVLCTVIMLPLSNLLEKLVTKLVPDSRRFDKDRSCTKLDERLLAAPPVALEQCSAVACEMAEISVEAIREAVKAFGGFSPELARSVRTKEEKTDRFEDILGTYLVKLSAMRISAEGNKEAAKLLKIIGDFERIADHAVNLLEAAEETENKKLQFTPAALAELKVLSSAVEKISELALKSFVTNDIEAALSVEPLEEVIDGLKEEIRSRHINRLQQGECSIAAGFVLSDMLTDLERVSDHCSNIALCIIDIAHNNMNMHRSEREMHRNSREFDRRFEEYSRIYSL
ncbi:MAG TPA: Na/Pi cotransporter [Ruminococcaceae bacterium]|nr:Na/Pi cotransporter [Oscillospiraceae bacterium]